MSNIVRILSRQLAAREALQAKEQQQPRQGGHHAWIDALVAELDRMMQDASAPTADLAARLQRLELAAAHKASDAGLEARLARLESTMKEFQAPSTELADRLAHLEKSVEAHQTTTSGHAAKLARLDKAADAGNSSFLGLAARLYDLETAQTGQTTAAAHPEAPQNAESPKTIIPHRDGAGMIVRVDIGDSHFHVVRDGAGQILRLEKED